MENSHRNDVIAFKKLFPSSNHKIYLNHAACSPYSIIVSRAMQDYITKAGGEVVENYPKNLETRERLRQKLAELIQAPASDIAIVKNTSSDLSLLAAGLEWKTGDRILFFDLELPSNIYPFMNCAHLGVEIDFVPARTMRNGQVQMEDIESRITPRTRLLTISFVEFLNGSRNDLDAIGELCRQHRIWFCVDGIQELGSLPLDLKYFSIHLLSSAAHRWLMDPQGIRLIYIHPELFKQLSITQIGWLSVKNAWIFFDYRLDWEEDARRFETGTENWIGVYGFLAAVELLLENGIDSIARQILDLTGYSLTSLEDMEILSATEEAHRSGIVTFRLPHDLESKQTEKIISLSHRKENHHFISRRIYPLFAPRIQYDG